MTPMLAQEPLWTEADVISRYTREQAIEDGMLIDVSEMAREAGFVIPVAVSAAVWADMVAWNKSNKGLQDEAGRLWDVLSVLRFSIRVNGSRDRVPVPVMRVPNTPKATCPRRTLAYAQCGPGDNAEPVITILMPGED